MENKTKYVNYFIRNLEKSTHTHLKSLAPLYNMSLEQFMNHVLKLGLQVIYDHEAKE